MGLFDAFRKRREEGTEDKEEYLLIKKENLLSWFKDEFNADLLRSQEEAFSIKQNLVKEFEGIKAASEKLDAAKFNGTERIHAAANMIKNSFVRRMHLLTENILRASQSSVKNHSSIQSFCNDAKKTIKEMKSATPKQAAMLSRYFESESSAVINAIKSAEETLNGLDNYLSSSGHILQVAEQLEEMIARYDALIEKARDLKSKQSKIRKQLKETEKEKKALEKKLSDMENTEEWNKMLAVKKDIESKKAELRELKDALATLLSPVRRPFKKLAHSHSAALSGEHKRCLMECIESPSDIILSDNGIETFRDLMKSVLSKCESGDILMKPREKEKLKRILSILDTDIYSLKKRHLSLKKEINELEAKQSESARILKERDEIKDKIKTLSQQIEELGIESGYALNESERLLDEAEKKKAEIESFLRKHTNRKIMIAKQDIKE